FTFVLQPGAPSPPEPFRVFEGSRVVNSLGIDEVRFAIGECEPYLLAFAEAKLGDCLEIFAVYRHVGMEHGEIGTGHRPDAVLNACHPWHGAAIIEAKRELHAHVERAANALDNADHVGIESANRHEIDQSD